MNDIMAIGIAGGTGSGNTTITRLVSDRFGKDVIVVADGPEHFTVALNVVTSPTFYAWLCGFGTEVEILSPPSARLEMQNMLAAAADLYAPPRRQ